MTHAYDEAFLDDAQDVLGTAVEYAVRSCGLDGQEFLRLFQASGIAARFGKGDARYLSGMSGIELARLVLDKCGKTTPTASDGVAADYPAEYWIGWILAYYQWMSGKPFSRILNKLTYPTLLNLYGVLHEADPTKAAESFDALMKQPAETNLARLRKLHGLSQSQLAAASGLSTRSIQLYEQRQCEINNAQWNRLQALANALDCEIESILE